MAEASGALQRLEDFEDDVEMMSNKNDNFRSFTSHKLSLVAYGSALHDDNNNEKGSYLEPWLKAPRHGDSMSHGVKASGTWDATQEDVADFKRANGIVAHCMNTDFLDYRLQRVGMQLT